MKDPRINALAGFALPGEQRRHAIWRSNWSAVLGAPAEWLRRQHDIRRLCSLDDRALRDIGVSRSEITRVVRRGRD